MNSYVVWLDSKNAHVFALKTSGVEKIFVEESGVDHHIHGQNEKHDASNMEHYYKNLAAKLKGADKLLLMGPGLAKKHFKDHLTTHEANSLAKKIVGMENVESSEHVTEKQMMAEARKFFKTYDLFNSPI